MHPDAVHDPDLLDLLEAIRPRVVDRFVWRVTWAGRDPRLGGTGGGRWHPPNDFEALYTSFEEDGAVAEVYYHLSRAPIFSSSHVRIHKLKVRTRRALVVADFSALEKLGISEDGFRRGDYVRSREVGSAARFLDADALVVPSARWQCLNLVLFSDRFSDRTSLSVEATKEVNWPAWRELTRQDVSDT